MRNGAFRLNQLEVRSYYRNKYKSEALLPFAQPRRGDIPGCAAEVAYNSGSILLDQLVLPLCFLDNR